MAVMRGNVNGNKQCGLKTESVGALKLDLGVEACVEQILSNVSQLVVGGSHIEFAIGESRSEKYYVCHDLKEIVLNLSKVQIFHISSIKLLF